MAAVLVIRIATAVAIGVKLRFIYSPLYWLSVKAGPFCAGSRHRRRAPRAAGRPCDSSYDKTNSTPI
jgi:hypothetical protein